MKNIETNRLILRNFSESDAPGLLAYMSAHRVNCFLDGRINTPEEALTEVRKRSEDDSQIAVALKEDNMLIGELFCMKEEPDTFSIGWNFNAAYEGKGLARESAEALLHHLFEEKEARRLYAYVEDNNFRSQKLCEKLGMRQEGCMKEFVSFTTNEDGTPKYENTFLYALLKKEWSSRRES
ncbi:GNAT family N-acetyltransferase [Saccharibacillus endophyticus]|uniref:N-acetyltransferase GCN5 n=1 Tax=Saccharibacillus endophyticus TaxID=2060666 RepID=A0ABQ2A2F2_9BACL|nr:GNAT family N-acetyltransferase [Saccharibacillus endophyticus]GGH83054.1 N-acetyltransferase GCN5 [Saccharibacillus endophyticus]